MPHTINFLHQTEPEEQQHPHRSRPKYARVIGVLLVFCVLAISWSALAVGRVAAAAFDGRDALYAARDAALAFDFEGAERSLEAADRSFLQVEQGLRALRWLKSFPWIGTQMEAAEVMAGVGRDLIETMKKLIDLGSQIFRLAGLTDAMIADLQQGVDVSLSYSELSPETKRAVLLRFAGAAPDFIQTVAEIDLALSELNGLKRNELAGPLLESLQPFQKKLMEARDTLQTLSIAASMLPTLGGLQEPTDILLLFMNNAELRPAGGFIGTYGYGVMRVEDGDIFDLTTQDVYHLDQAADPYFFKEPPAPLKQYNATEKWYLRDSNWSPDFAVAARQAVALFDEEVMSLPADGRNLVQPPVSFEAVVGFTPTFAEAMLQIVGPITIGAQTYTAENLVEALQYQVEYGFEQQGLPVEQRKVVIRDLVQETKARLFALPLAVWPQAVQTIATAAEEKQLVLYSAQDATQQLLTDAGWAGRMQSSTPDTLLVVDANLASLKTDPAVKREIAYSVNRSDQGYVGRVTISYRHEGDFDWKTTRYRTYTRVFVPEGSVLLRSSGALKNDALQNPSNEPGTVDVGSELGLTVFGAFTSVEPGQTRELTFEYLLPAFYGMEKGRYSLTVLKQIGAQDHTLTLDLDFDKKVTTAAPPEASHLWGDDRYQLEVGLERDVVVEVGLE